MTEIFTSSQLIERIFPRTPVIKTASLRYILTTQKLSCLQSKSLQTSLLNLSEIVILFDIYAAKIPQSLKFNRFKLPGPWHPDLFVKIPPLFLAVIDDFTTS